MTDPDAVAHAYLASWNASPENRAGTLEAWSADATYADPLMAEKGRDGIAAMMNRATAQFPNHRFELDGSPDGHGPFVRFGWALRSGAGATAARGTDVVRLDAEGRIAEVIGFLDGGVA